MWPFRNGWRASLFMASKVGDMMNRLRNRASPTTTWLGGIVGRPSALRVIESTITMRVKAGQHDQQRRRHRQHGQRQDDQHALGRLVVGTLGRDLRRARGPLWPRPGPALVDVRAPPLRYRPVAVE